MLARMMMMGAALLAASPAQAGSGPWALAKGDHNLFVGFEGQRFTRLARELSPVATPGNPAPEYDARADCRDPGPDANCRVFDLGEGFTSFGVQGIFTYGVTGRFEFEVAVPWIHSQATRTDVGPCLPARQGGLGLQACATTAGVGVITTRGKGVVLDELSGAPLSLSLGGEIRYGGFTAPTRARLTAIGEGTTDLGAVLAVGRTGGLGSEGYWSWFVEGVGRYRFPNTDNFPLSKPNQNLSVPGEEIYVQSDLFVAPRRSFAVGPSVDVFSRLRGVGLSEIVADDIDRFVALKGSIVRLGGKLVLRDERNTAFVVSAHHNVLATNNPADTVSVSAGISVNRIFSRSQP